MSSKIKSLDLSNSFLAQVKDTSAIYEWIIKNCENLESYVHRISYFNNFNSLHKLTPLVKRLKSFSFNGDHRLEIYDSLSDCFKDTQLEELKVTDLSNVTENFFKYVTNLKSLEVVRCSITSESLIEVLKKNFTLKNLKISTCHPVNSYPDYLKDSSQLIEFISNHLKEIEELSFNIMAPNISILDDLPKLKKLEITQIPKQRTDVTATAQEMNKLLEKLSQKNILEELDIISLELSINIDHISKLTNLKKLSVKGVQNLTDADFNKLQCLSNLESLTIGNNELRTFSFFSLIESLPNLKLMVMQKVHCLNFHFFDELIRILKKLKNRPKLKLCVGKIYAAGYQIKIQELFDNNKHLIKVSHIDWYAKDEYEFNYDDDNNSYDDDEDTTDYNSDDY